MDAYIWSAVWLSGVVEERIVRAYVLLGPTIALHGKHSPEHGKHSPEQPFIVLLFGKLDGVNISFVD